MHTCKKVEIGKIELCTLQTTMDNLSLINLVLLAIWKSVNALKMRQIVQSFNRYYSVEFQITTYLNIEHLHGNILSIVQSYSHKCM